MDFKAACSNTDEAHRQRIAQQTQNECSVITVV